MECRRLSTTAVSFGYAAEDKLKRNQYLTVIKCQLSGPEAELGEVFRYTADQHSYYAVLNETGDIHWFAVSGTSSALAKYPVLVSETQTNLLGFLSSEKTPPLEGPFFPITSRTKICLAAGAVFVETPGTIRVFPDLVGIPCGMEQVSVLRASVCEQFLVVFFESGRLLVVNLADYSTRYQQNFSPGNLQLFGDVFDFAILLLTADKTATLIRATDGLVLLELSFPEPISAATIDLLQRRLVVGTVSGSLYQVRLDGEPAEFAQAKISSHPVTALFFALCGTIFYAQAGGFILVLSVRDGQPLRTLASTGKLFFTRTTNSNLHLQ